MPEWQLAGITSLCLLAAGIGALPLRRRRWAEFLGAFGREAGIIVGLFTLWQIVRILAITKVTGGIENGVWIYHRELAVHLPDELRIEDWFLRHPWLMRRVNTYYAYVHFPAMTVFLVWLFVRHRPGYRRVRDTIVLLTGSCLLIQMLVPVAPPRMLVGEGFSDEALAFGQSVYGTFGEGIAAQLSAMPSVHVAWAALIAYQVIRVSPSRWRWLTLAHPVVTTLAVVATANHYWADGIVAVVLLVLADLGARGIDRLRTTARRWASSREERTHRSAPTPAPVPAPVGAPPPADLGPLAAP